MSGNLKINPEVYLNLKKNNIPESVIPILVSGSLYFEHSGGLSSNSYWLNSKFDNRDEFFVLLNAYFGLAGVLNKVHHCNEWKLKFDVAYLFQVKSFAQSAVAIDRLTKSFCYSDAFVVCRTMISRSNLLILFALNPNLFNVWLQNPKDEKFLDGHIREELTNNGINTVQHLYEFSSEIIHSQFESLSNIGYLEQGLFPELPAIHNQIYVIAKFLLGMSYATMLFMYTQDNYKNNHTDDLKDHYVLFSWLKNNYLIYNRFDHLWTFIAEDRHWRKTGKDKHSIGGFFNFNELENQIEKFHRKNGQRKKLSKKYNI